MKLYYLFKKVMMVCSELLNGNIVKINLSQLNSERCKNNISSNHIE